jgi:cysteine desulfurase
MSVYYYDYAATTPLDPLVLEAMLPSLREPALQGNAHSSHCFGDRAAHAIARARMEVAELLHASPEEIIFTSGASEANHAALTGAAHFYHSRGRHILISAIEHPSVRETAAHLARSGFQVTEVPVAANGSVSWQDFQSRIQSDTVLISLMLVNNETGVIQPVSEIAMQARKMGIKIHTDAVQAAGKIPLDVATLGVDYLSLSGHKLYGPKGVGALYIRSRPRARLTPWLHGGGQEQSLRAGTLPTAQIIGLGSACTLAQSRLSLDHVRLIQYQQKIERSLAELGDIHIHGQNAQRVPHILNFTVPEVDGESLRARLFDCALGAGSACHGDHQMPSSVLLAMGVAPQLAHSAVRISLGHLSSETEVNHLCQRLQEEIKFLRRLSPLTKGGEYVA